MGLTNNTEKENDIWIFLHNFPSAVEILLLKKNQCQLNQSSNRSKPTINPFVWARLQKNLPF
jgi:hypothetical protein